MSVITPERSLRELEQLTRARELVASGRARELRIAAHLSQSEIADACGVAPSAISRWEAGDRVPRGRAARIYAAFLTGLEHRSSDAHNKLDPGATHPEAEKINEPITAASHDRE